MLNLISVKHIFHEMRVRMKNHTFKRWKEERGIHMDEDFTLILERYVNDYKKKRTEKH